MSNNSTTGQHTVKIPDRLRGLRERLSDVQQILQTQRELLTQRNISLPDEPLIQLSQLGERLGQLQNEDSYSTQLELRSLRALAQTAALINSSQRTDDVLNEVMDTVIALTGAERGYVVLKNQDTGELEFQVARGMDQAQLSGNKAMVISKTIVNTVADTGEPVLTDNASQDERYQSNDSIVGFQLRSILAVPLKLRDVVIGVVYCDNRFLSGLFKVDDLQMLSAFANQAAVAIENARLFEAARQRLDEVSQIRDRMNNLFTSIASGVLTVDHDNHVISINAAARELLQPPPDAEMLNLYQILPPLDSQFSAALQRVRMEGTHEELALQPEIPGRGRRYWEMIFSPLLDVDGLPQGVAIVLDDLTEQKARESQLAEVRRYLPLALVESIQHIDQVDVQGQEREITALFADLRGFTTFSERLQPEALMEIINKYLSLASDSINLYEGIVDKYMGDAVTGLFNTQLNPQEDHALRAVQAAMQLVLDLYAQHEVMPDTERLYFGIGIHSGPAVLGNVGGTQRKEFAALGEATELCKFLQEQAGPGEVIISEATFARIQDQFECEPCDTKRPKSGYESVQCYRVLRRKKGVRSESLFVDQELLDLLNDTELD